MYKLLKRVENTDHTERFGMLVDTHWWGISICYDYDFYRNCMCLMVQFLCFKFRWSFYKGAEK